MTTLTIDQMMQIARQHHKAGRTADAEAIYRQVIRQRPDYADALHLAGLLLGEAGRLAQAIDMIHRAIALKPTVAEYYANLGEFHRRHGNLDEAVAASTKAVELKPEHSEVHYNLGLALHRQGRIDDAITAYREAIQRRANHAGAYSNLGVALQDKGQIPEALTAFETAIKLAPEEAKCRYNLANALRDAGLFSEANAAFEKAVELKPDFAIAHFNLALNLLRLGAFERGWAEYEWRFKCVSRLRTRPFREPRWNGEALDGKTILLHAEQGFGDTIQFSRYAALVAERGGRVILECPRELVRLMRTCPGVAQAVAEGEPPQPFEMQCPQLSLPGIFRTTLASIPSAPRYLEAEPSQIEVWSRRLGNANGPFRIGLAWAGRPTHENDRTRSIRLTQLTPLFEIPGVRFHSLQKGEATAQIEELPHGLLTNDAAELTDFADTAAYVANLDLVITVDTAIAHLAGAMGKPVWVMLSHLPDWRWLLERNDSPWYPSMRLFRQQSPGDWAGVVARVAEALASHAAAYRS